MGQVLWIVLVAAAVGALIGLTSTSDEAARANALAGPVESAPVAPIGVPEDSDFGSSGRALAAAAFGLMALQPETYDGELVLEIIDASPLDEARKDELTANLEAAEAGSADLHEVLADVRTALAVE